MPQAAPLVAAEAAIATTMTAEAAAALAAEQAAAALAAEQAAAAAAAEQAAAMAAEQAAAQAATQATAQAAEQAVAQTTNTGIQTLAKEVTGTQATGIEQVFQNAQASNVPMSQAEFLNNSLAGANTPFNPAQPFANSTAIVAPPAPPVQTALPAAPPAAAPPAAAPAPTPAPAAVPAPTISSAYASPNTDPTLGGAGTGYQGSAVQVGGASDATAYTPADLKTMQGPPLQSPLQSSSPANGIEDLFNKGIDYVKQNPLTSLLGANALSGFLDKPKPKEEEKYKSTFDSSKYTGYQPVQPEPYKPQYAHGGLADLGGYSDGGRMLKGPGDGMSDDIPATIAGKQPARLANEEFVIPADVVSHLGNGSSEAGAKQLYKMMDRIRKARTGTKKQGKQINPEKYLA